MHRLVLLKTCTLNFSQLPALSLAVENTSATIYMHKGPTELFQLQESVVYMLVAASVITEVIVHAPKIS